MATYSDSGKKPVKTKFKTKDMKMVKRSPDSEDIDKINVLSRNPKKRESLAKRKTT